MRIYRPTIVIISLIGAGLLPTHQAAAATTTAPADSGNSAMTQSPTRTAQQVMADISSDQKDVAGLMGRGDAVLKNPADRSAAAPKLIPAIQKMQTDLNELATVSPQFKVQVQNMKPRLQTMLSVLGDKESTAQIQTLAASKDPAQSLEGQSDQFLAQWLVADKTAPAQTPLIDELEKLDRAHPDSVSMTMLTAQLSRDAASADISKRMLTIATDEMNNPAAKAIKQQLTAMDTAAEKAASAENKPLTLSGVTPDSKPFSSSDFKGKVVLVDFWATWCGPCREELPRVKKIYSDYHDKGLEILGVSNDYNVDALKSFTAKEQMPWPELFDATAASNQQWNPITLNQGINGIPTMYLIDKKGVLRTVNARENMEEMIPKLLAESN